MQSASMPSIALFNPPVFGNFSGLNYAAWFFNHVLFERKFLSLFAILFGASLLMFFDSKGDAAPTLHRRRSAVLIGLGILHAYLLWAGDILFIFGVCALAVVKLRHFSAHTLLVLGCLLYSVRPFIIFTVFGDVSPTTWNPPAGVIQNELNTYRGSWVEQLGARAEEAMRAQTIEFALFTFWRISGLMVFGMALYKLDIISNVRSAQFYRRLFVASGMVGITVTLAGVWYITANGWTADAGRTWRLMTYVGAPILATSYVAATMLVVRYAPYSYITDGFAAVGRTALSNYLFQTLLLATIFYGHGLGLFGHVSRIEQAGLILLIWSIHLILSVAWMNRYRFGPVGWALRCLTYGERYPLRRK